MYFFMYLQKLTVIEHRLSKNHRMKRNNNMDMIMGNSTMPESMAESHIEATYKLCI